LSKRRSYLSLVSPTYLENWPAALLTLSVRQTGVSLAPDEAHALGALNGIHPHRFARPAESTQSSLQYKLDGLFEDFPEGAFVRLGSRSAKDTALGLLTGCFCSSGESALRLLTNGSSRLAFDLGMAVQGGYSPHVFAREWLQIEPWMELRCFMRERSLVGVSQYHYTNAEAGKTIESRRDKMLASVVDFFPRFCAACHLDTVVFDLVMPSASGSGSVPLLLEINPWTAATDFGLFDGRSNADFDGSFRYYERYAGQIGSVSL
jgi:hypothetical protein